MAADRSRKQVVPAGEQLVRQLMPRGGRLTVETRASAEPAQRWIARARSRLWGLGWGATGLGRDRDECLANLGVALAGISLARTLDQLGWRLAPGYEPADFPDEVTFPVEVDRGVVGIIVDVSQDERTLRASRSTLAELYPDASVVVVAPEVVPDPRALKHAVDDASPPSHVPQGPKGPPAQGAPLPRGLARLEREGLLRRGEGDLLDVRPVPLPRGAPRPSDRVAEGRDG